MRLEFEGFVEGRQESEAHGTEYWVGGKHVVSEIESAMRDAFGSEYDKKWPEMHVVIADGSYWRDPEEYKGDLDLYVADCGYSEYTPGSSDRLEVGDHDVFQRIRNNVGRKVKLIVSDETINVLAEG